MGVGGTNGVNEHFLAIKKRVRWNFGSITDQ